MHSTRLSQNARVKAMTRPGVALMSPELTKTPTSNSEEQSNAVFRTISLDYGPMLLLYKGYCAFRLPPTNR